MKQVFEPDPAEEQQREEANILMLRVGLALIDDARRAEAFEVDEAKLERRVAELWGSLASDDSIGKQAPVTATPIDAERLQLSVLLDQNHSVGAVLRRDGVLLEEYAGFGLSADAELSPQEQEQLRVAQEGHEALMRRSQFHGRHFLRTLSVDPQPGSEVQILAAELFDDGIIVHFTHDQSEDNRGKGEWDDAAEAFKRGIGIRIEDDLGTEYLESGGNAGGVQVIHGAQTFAPAAPSGARILRVTSRAGTVELLLGD